LFGPYLFDFGHNQNNLVGRTPTPIAPTRCSRGWGAVSPKEGFVSNGVFGDIPHAIYDVRHSTYEVDFGGWE